MVVAKKSTSKASPRKAPAKRASPAQTEAANLAAVAGFFDALVKKKDPEGVASYLSEDFVSHSPDVDGRQGMADFAGWQAANQPDADFVEVFHIIAKGNKVVYHYTYSSDPAKGAEMTIVDVFTVKDGKITEYWDVIKSSKE